VIFEMSFAKILVWQSDDQRVWVSSTNSSYLQTRYAISQTLIGNIAGVAAVLEQTLKS
jgi:uncharacterized protein (DUF302 family)